VLRNVLGYQDHEIDTELRALNQRIDIALRGCQTTGFGGLLTLA
jgi:hypothetical protein